MLGSPAHIIGFVRGVPRWITNRAQKQRCPLWHMPIGAIALAIGHAVDYRRWRRRGNCVCRFVMCKLDGDYYYAIMCALHDFHEDSMSKNDERSFDGSALAYSATPSCSRDQQHLPAHEIMNKRRVSMLWKAAVYNVSMENGVNCIARVCVRSWT